MRNYKLICKQCNKIFIANHNGYKLCNDCRNNKFKGICPVCNKENFDNNFHKLCNECYNIIKGNNKYLLYCKWCDEYYSANHNLTKHEKCNKLTLKKKCNNCQIEFYTWSSQIKFCDKCQIELQKSDSVRLYEKLISDEKNEQENDFILLPIIYDEKLNNYNKDFKEKECKYCKRKFKPYTPVQNACGRCFKINICLECKNKYVRCRNIDESGNPIGPRNEDSYFCSLSCNSAHNYKNNLKSNKNNFSIVINKLKSDNNFNNIYQNMKNDESINILIKNYNYYGNKFVLFINSFKNCQDFNNLNKSLIIKEIKKYLKLYKYLVDQQEDLYDSILDLCKKYNFNGNISKMIASARKVGFKTNNVLNDLESYFLYRENKNKEFLEKQNIKYQLLQVKKCNQIKLKNFKNNNLNNKINILKNLLNNGINYDNINIYTINIKNYLYVPGILFIWGYDNQTNEFKCLTGGQTKNLYHHIKFFELYSDKNKIKPDENDNRWYEIANNYHNFEIEIILENENDFNKREIIESKYAFDNKAIYWKPSVTQKYLNWEEIYESYNK